MNICSMYPVRGTHATPRRRVHAVAPPRARAVLHERGRHSPSPISITYCVATVTSDQLVALQRIRDEKRTNIILHGGLVLRVPPGRFAGQQVSSALARH